jgi:hypothetical protein
LIHKFTGRTTLLNSVNVLGSELGVPKANQAYRPELVPVLHQGAAAAGVVPAGASEGAEAKVEVKREDEQAGQMPNREAVPEGQVQS